MRWELLDRYLLGECTPAELAESPAGRMLLAQLDEPDSAAARARKAAAWDRLKRELDPDRKLGGDD
jgi:hypothetical protein